MNTCIHSGNIQMCVQPNAELSSVQSIFCMDQLISFLRRIRAFIDRVLYANQAQEKYFNAFLLKNKYPRFYPPPRVTLGVAFFEENVLIFSVSKGDPLIGLTISTG